MVLHGVDDDEYISKVSRDDAPSVVPCVLRPHNVHFIISQMTKLDTQYKDRETAV